MPDYEETPRNKQKEKKTMAQAADPKEVYLKAIAENKEQIKQYKLAIKQHKLLIKQAKLTYQIERI